MERRPLHDSRDVRGLQFAKNRSACSIALCSFAGTGVTRQAGSTGRDAHKPTYVWCRRSG